MLILYDYAEMCVFGRFDSYGIKKDKRNISGVFQKQGARDSAERADGGEE